MKYEALIIVIKDEALISESTLKSIQNQSYKDIVIKEISSTDKLIQLKNLLDGASQDAVIFIKDNDTIGIDYIRKAINELSQKKADLIPGEYLEKVGDDLFFPNRSFNQSKIELAGKEIVEFYDNFSDIDSSISCIFGKLYRKDILIDSLSGIDNDEKLDVIYSKIIKFIFNKAKIMSSIKNDYYILNREDNYFLDKQDYFFPRYTKVDIPLYFEEMKNKILDKDIKVISFDIFDTLILRPFLYPTDLFIILGQYVDEILPSIDGVDFYNIRKLSEINIRRKYSERKIGEVTLDDIYKDISRSCPVLKQYLDKIKQKEKSLEIEYCYARKIGKELYDLALYAGKRVIFTSDMYLPEDTIRQILDKNDYKEKALFLSSTHIKTKAGGELYDVVLKALDCPSEEILHIGDNFGTDVVIAKQKGLNALHLPRAEELFNNWNQNIYTGTYFSAMFETRNGIVQNHDAKELFGIRCMLAVVANKLYDYPFPVYSRASDFNGNPYIIGYFALGMHIYAIAKWLIINTQEKGYKNIHFMARDGYVVKEAYRIMNSIYKLDVNQYYTFMTRKSLAPLTLQSEIDCLNLMNNFNGVNILPKVVFETIEPVIKKVNKRGLYNLCKEYGIAYDKELGSKEKFLRLSKMISEKLFDKEKAKDFKEKFNNNFSGQFSGKTATFDMGYSARVESILKANFGYDITANYIHTTLDRAYQRNIRNGIEIDCFYDFAPFVSGITREILMSQPSGSCIGYKFNDNEAEIILGESDINKETFYAISNVQRAALDFVKDMFNIFGEYNKKLNIRNYYASIPLDYYLLSSKDFDRSMFSHTVFEDDMGLGNNIEFKSFWERIIERPYFHTINYNQYGRIRRYIIMLLCGDMGAIKIRVKEKLYRRRFLYNFAKAVYSVPRGIYRLFKR